MRRTSLILLCLLSAGFITAFAQAQRSELPVSNLRKKMISTKKTVLLDTLSIVPKTVNIPGVPDSAYQVDWVNATLIWKQVPPFDSVLISYRVFPARLNATVKRMSFDSVMNNFMGKPFVPDFGTNERDSRFLISEI